MKIPSSNLEAFYFLAQEKNFTRAAKKIGLSQPAFSQRISALEKFLESTLVIREKGSITLTNAGSKLLKYCKVNSLIENELLNEFLSYSENSQGIMGQIRIAGFSSVMRSLLLPSLSKLLTKNENLSIQTYTDKLDKIEAYLFSSKVDFILHNKPINKEGVVSEFLGYEENVLVQSRSYPSINTYLDHDERNVTTSSYFSKSTRPKKLRYVDDVYGLIDGVKTGLGKAILPKHLLDDNKFQIINEKKVMKVKVYLSYYEAPYYTRFQKEVINQIKNYFSKQLK